MNKDKIFVDGIRKYICVGYSETERPIYELSPEYEEYMKEKSPQNLSKADAYSLLAEVRAVLSVGICEKDYKYLEKALDLINDGEYFS